MVDNGELRTDVLRLTRKHTTDFMEQCPWDSDSPSAGQEISRVQNNPPLDHILNQVNSVFLLTSFVR